MSITALYPYGTPGPEQTFTAKTPLVDGNTETCGYTICFDTQGQGVVSAIDESEGHESDVTC